MTLASHKAHFRGTRSLIGVLLVSALLFFGGSRVCAADGTKHPNLLIILADDLGIGDVSCYNPKSVWQTPNLDRLAGQGMAFTDAHAASSLCTPSRYALLTGRYPWRTTLKHGVAAGYGNALIEPNRMTLASMLRSQGYTTAMLGKWHLGLNWVRTGPHLEDVDFTQPFGGGPLAHGFDHFLGISASLDMPPYVWLENDRALDVPRGHIDYHAPPLLWNPGAISAKFHMEEVEPKLMEEASKYLSERAKANDGKPFFLYVALTAPHTPILPLPEFQGKARATPYGDFVLQVDAHVGQLMSVLDQTGLADNTLVIVTSDNGFAPAAGLPELLRLGHHPSAGYRGYKSDLYEGGHRIPLITRWPARSPAGMRPSAAIEQLDFFATFSELLDIKLPADAAEDSISLLPLLLGKVQSNREYLVETSADGRFTISQGKWKLLLWPGSGGWSSPTPHPSQWLKVPATDLSTLPKYQLYDLETDPAEQTNLLASHPEVVQRLGRMARRYILEGRSTPGPAQANETPLWSQTDWMKDFVADKAP